VRHISLFYKPFFLKLKPIQLSSWPAPAQTSPCRPSDRDEHCPGHHFLAVFRAVPILCLYRAASSDGVPSLTSCTSTSSSMSPHTLKAAALHSAELPRHAASRACSHGPSDSYWKGLPQPLALRRA